MFVKEDPDGQKKKKKKKSGSGLLLYKIGVLENFAKLKLPGPETLFNKVAGF